MRSLLTLVAILVAITSISEAKELSYQTYDSSLELKVEEFAVNEDMNVKVKEGILQTCSGVEYNQMTCSCLANAYNLRECPDRLNYSGGCATYSHHCKRLTGGKREKKTCCKAIMCLREARSCY